MAKRNLRVGNVALAMAVIVGGISLADYFTRDARKPEGNGIIDIGEFRQENSPEPVSDATALANGSAGTTIGNMKPVGMQNVGFSELNVDISDLSVGKLALINAASAGAVSRNDMVDLMKEKNEYYTLVDDSVMLNKEAAEAFNLMMADYNAATGLYDFIVYGTTQTYTGAGSYCPEFFAESAAGNTVDLAVNGHSAVLQYDGNDEEGWVVDNCAKYGFIVRYPKGKAGATGHEYCPWHLRYVGKVHSSIMAEKNLCLEEYVDFLKNYSYNSPLKYSTNEVNYEIYNTRSTGASTTVMIPIAGNYELSGNNVDSYIITAIKD